MPTEIEFHRTGFVEELRAFLAERGIRNAEIEVEAEATVKPDAPSNATWSSTMVRVGEDDAGRSRYAETGQLEGAFLRIYVRGMVE